MIAKASAWVLCVFFFFGCTELPDTRNVLIVIHTTHFTKTAWIRVERNNGKCVAENMEIPDEQVAAFLAAVDTRSDGPISFSNLGLTQNWLDQNAEPAFNEYFKGRTSSVLSSQRDLFISRFRNASAIGKAVDEYFQSWWTDDVSIVHVEIYDRSSGRAIVMESSGLHAFMIPWTIAEKGRSRLSFNANIGRTLGVLLPENAALKERISGIYFRPALSQALYGQMCGEWRKLDKNPKLRIHPRDWYTPAPKDDYFYVPDPCYMPGSD